MDTQAVQDRSLVAALHRQCRFNPDAQAYRQGDTVLTFAEVDRISNRIANTLAAEGVGPDSRVACLTKHHVECLLLTLAACKLGAVCMPVNWRLAPAEIEFIVNHGEAVMVMADAAFITPFVADGQGIHTPAVRRIVCTDAADTGFVRFAEWYASGSDDFDAVPSDLDDTALQLYSSGTTGLPKGVVLSHRGMLSTVRVVAREWAFDQRCVFANPLPTFHVAGMAMLILTLYSGGRSCTFQEFDPPGFAATVRREGVTHTFLVPTMILYLLRVPGLAEDCRTLRLIAYGASPSGEQLLRDAMAVLSCGFLQVYGLTEVSGPVTFLMPEDHCLDGPAAERLRSAGKPVGGARIRIVDPGTLQDVAAGQSGEVWIECERNMKAYWRNPRATEDAFPEGRNANGGWFRSGDGGYLRDGFLYIRDRIKDMIISGGENVYPAEIENVLTQHPSVAEGAVIGVPDPVWGESVKACVVLKPGATLGERELIDWLRERLAHFKCPKSVDFLKTLPRNPSGKILKRVLRGSYDEVSGPGGQAR